MRRPKVTFFILILGCLGSQVIRADWVKQTTNSFAWYRDITFVTKGRGWIVGTDGVMLTTDNGGATWQPHQRTTTDSIIQIHFTDESTGWILCERNVYARGKDPISYLQKTTNGGRTWDKIEFQDAGRERVTRMLFGPDGKATAFGEGGYFYKLQDDGITWKKFTSAIHFLLLDGAYSGDSLGAIVGAGGTIMFTEDAGLTWEAATVLGDTDTKFNAVSFGSKGGWAVGNGGKIFHSNAGAKLWREQSRVTTSNLNDVYFANASTGWVVGDDGEILRTRDGGNSWTEMRSNVNHRLEKIVFLGSKGFAIGHGGTILVYDENAHQVETPREKPTLLKRN
jgi:photosystem II stability/assembly factor-like uncharacterized protein